PNHWQICQSTPHKGIDFFEMETDKAFIPTRRNKDHLSKKVGINAQLTETGISAETRSRTAAAIDRLGGSLLDVP
ncbi:MAG: hypothetical protein OXC82_09525, partial [Rhodobacteraceae bacterium]|nr:hypothetical protein [Paracoccaceae bacterium]